MLQHIWHNLGIEICTTCRAAPPRGHENLHHWGSETCTTCGASCKHQCHTHASNNSLYTVRTSFHGQPSHSAANHHAVCTQCQPPTHALEDLKRTNTRSSVTDAGTMHAHRPPASQHFLLARTSIQATLQAKLPPVQQSHRSVTQLPQELSHTEGSTICQYHKPSHHMISSYGKLHDHTTAA
eukprot:jgi/Ulvmu1/6509/UM003_0142.1